jgi:hypothetical protein
LRKTTSPEERMARAGGTTERWGPEGGPKPNGKENGHDTANGHDPSALEFTKLEPIDPSKLPPRQWAYGHFLLFGSAGVIGAVDGAGKGFIAIAMAISMITGLPLLGERVWRTGAVAVVSYEDDKEEWHRRIAAACIYFAVDYAKVISKICVIHRPGGRVTFAASSPTGAITHPDSEQIIEYLRVNDAVMLIIDPFNSAHDLADGNSNVAIAKVAYEISRIAKVANVATLVLHHLRKGALGDIDDLMGATSLRANFRSCRILARMTTDEAEQLGIDVTERWRYLRIAGNKANYAPPPETATWFKLETTKLGNGAGIYDLGDQIAVATTWEAPKAFDGISTVILKRIFDRLRGEPEPGWFYSAEPRANYWAGTVLVDEAGRTRKQAATVLKTWKDSGVLTVETYKTPSRNDASRIVLNEVKVAEILAPAVFVDD